MAAESLLCVEGVEDQLFFQQLCRTRGLNVAGNVRCDPAGKGNAITTFVAALQLRRHTSLGLVVDADLPAHGGGLAATVRTINQRLSDVGMKPLSLRSGGGFETTLQKVGKPCKVGVWVMPDNASDGYLEHLLQGLVGVAHQPSLQHARQATAAAMAANVGFTAKAHHRVKADLGAFLAWHDVPRMSFGKALSDGYLEESQPNAGSLLNWLNWLYQ